MRVPLYEEVPIEMIMGRCWVLDPTTFCKGRPVDSAEEHVYICELRVDKAARSFAKIGKNQYPVCQKSYAFQKFEQKLKIQRTYMVSVWNVNVDIVIDEIICFDLAARRRHCASQTEEEEVRGSSVDDSLFAQEFASDRAAYADSSKGTFLRL